MLLLEMRFRKTRPFDQTTLRLSEEKLATEAFNANFQSIGVKLQSAEVKGVSWQGAMRVYPNPAGSVVNIEWRQEKKGIATIRIVDAAGRVVYKHQGFYEYGMQRHVILRRLSAVATSSMVAQVECDGRIFTAKIVASQ